MTTADTIDVTTFRFEGVNRQTARRLRRTLLASTTGVDDHGRKLGPPTRPARVELIAYFTWRAKLEAEADA